jgi:hypothetical protein
MTNSTTSIPATPLRLNLGSGQNPLAGFLNVDKFGSPDVRHDLETFPWPWPDNSVDEIAMIHVLEHLGESVATFFSIMKELYRICKHNAQITIWVPHPRHNDFISDPTHVRPFTAESFTLYSKEMNRKWQAARASNSPLAMYLDIDFNIAWVQYDLEQPWAEQLKTGKITQKEIQEAASRYNNVIRQIRLRLAANKPGVPEAVAPIV